MYAKDEKQMLVTRMIITVIQPKKDWIYSTYSSLNYNLDCSAKFLTFLQYFYYYYFFIFLATTAVSFFLPFCFLFFFVCVKTKGVLLLIGRWCFFFCYSSFHSSGKAFQ